MTKLSKSDDPQAVQEIASLPVSKHFTVGESIVMDNRRGEILAVLTCKCRLAEKALRIRWDDGSMGIIEPIALNH